MKKGFTLIELLVTIVVIGIVAMIAYPAVGNVMTSMKERSFIESRKGLIRAAKLYVEANQNILPYNVGDVSELSISTLVNSKYIKEVKSPVDGSTCGGYILIRQNETTGYDYYPQYRCGASSSITSRAEDSLVLDYTFDDFQEPTSNIVPNSPVNSYPKIGNTHGTYNTNQYNNNTYFSIGTIGSISNNVVTLSSIGMPIYTYDVLTPQTTGGGVTAGTRYYIKKLSNNTFTLHAYDTSQDGSKGFKVHDSINNDVRINVNATGFPTMWHGPAHLPNSALVKEIIPNCFSTLSATKHECIRLHTSHKPEGSVDGMAYGVTPPVTAGKTYTFSFYYRAVDDQSVGKTIHLAAHTASSWPSMGVTKTLTRDWQRYVITSVAPATGNTFLYFWPSKGANIDISEIQVEEKDHVTEFTTGTRTGAVTDYSGNNLNSSLSSISTPSWVSNGIKGGAYKFTTNTSIDIPINMNNTNYGLTNATYTHSFWLKLNQHSAIGNGLIFGMAYYNGFGFQVNADGVSNTNIRGYFRNASSPYATAAKTLNLNEWYHLVLVLNKPQSKISFYVNGELYGEATITTGAFTYENYPFALNKVVYPAGSAPWTNIDGYMDEVKIFNRVLTTDEIKSLYYMERVN